MLESVVMLTLETDKVPSLTAELVEVVRRSILRWIAVPDPTRLVRATGTLPNLNSATVNLSGGTADSSKGLPQYEPTAATEPGPRIATARVVASPLTVDGIAFDFDLTAANLAFAYARGGTGRLVVVLDSAEGNLSIQVSRSNLEAAILKAARTATAGTGVAILKVESTLNAITPRQLEMKLNITAKKFVTATIRIAGRLTIDDHLRATATELKAEGEGMVGSIAVGFLRPHLEKIQGNPLSLMKLSLGKVKLHDVAVNTDTGLKLTAEFGHA